MKLEGPKLYVTIGPDVRYDVHSVYVFIRNFHNPERKIMLNLKSIFVIVHDFLDENIFRKSEKVVIQRIQLHGASGGIGLLKMGVQGD